MTLCNIFIFYFQDSTLALWFPNASLPFFFSLSPTFSSSPFFRERETPFHSSLFSSSSSKSNFECIFTPNPKTLHPFTADLPPPLHAADSVLETLFSPEFGGYFLAFTVRTWKRKWEVKNYFWLKSHLITHGRLVSHYTVNLFSPPTFSWPSWVPKTVSTRTSNCSETRTPIPIPNIFYYIGCKKAYFH